MVKLNIQKENDPKTNTSVMGFMVIFHKLSFDLTEKGFLISMYNHTVNQVSKNLFIIFRFNAFSIFLLIAYYCFSDPNTLTLCKDYGSYGR